MDKETFEQNIRDAIPILIKMVKESCWNKMSENYSFILSEINNSEGKSFLEQRIVRCKLNDNKSPKSFEKIIAELNELYSNLYDVNLYIYKAEKRRTIIEIQYFPKTSLDKEYLQQVLFQNPMLHCKISNPPYVSEKKEKFDINWEFGGIRYNWEMFWWKTKLKKEIRKMKS